MKLQFIYPYWGSDRYGPSAFFDVLRANGFQGVEIDLPKDPLFVKGFCSELARSKRDDPNFKFAYLQFREYVKETPEQYTTAVLKKLKDISGLAPDFINSHTGKDHFSFDENCRIIDALENFSVKTGIPVMHEIHRGRFSFHSTTTLPYLYKFPEIKLVGDFSHWGVVSETMLEDQEGLMEEVVPHIHHIHARIGHEESPQVNDPFAPEWKGHSNIFVNWWKKIIDFRRRHGYTGTTITPEFGPYPYMTETPYERLPLGDQEDINIRLRALLEKEL